MDLALGLINGPCWLSLARSLCYIRCHSRWGIRRHRCQKEAFCNWNGSSSSIIQDPGQNTPPPYKTWVGAAPMQQRSVDSLGSLRGNAVWLGLAISGKLWIGDKSGSSSRQWVQLSLVCTVFGLSPRQGISIASFLRITEEIPVKPNPIFRAKILCMCEIKASDKDKLCEMMSLQTVCGAGWERESPGAYADSVTIRGAS